MDKSYKRKISTREPAPDLIIIYTEGTRTEPYYFDSFKLHPVILKTIGLGMNTKSLVRYVEREVGKVVKEYSKKHNMPLEEVEYVVWCVFDKDDFKTADFNDAIRMAESKGYKVAYSNEAFELWYVLHYHYLDTGISRDQYCEILRKNTRNKQYEKTRPDMYDELNNRQHIAVKYSKKLFNQYPLNSTPADRNPVTKVHDLVLYLNQFLR
jgi:hypothetical protein